MDWSKIPPRRIFMLALLLLCLHSAGRLLLPSELLHCVAPVPPSRPPGHQRGKAGSASLLSCCHFSGGKKNPNNLGQFQWCLSGILVFRSLTITSSKWKSDCVVPHCWLFFNYPCFPGCAPLLPCPCLLAWIAPRYNSNCRRALVHDLINLSFDFHLFPCCHK